MHVRLNTKNPFLAPTTSRHWMKLKTTHPLHGPLAQAFTRDRHSPANDSHWKVNFGNMQIALLLCWCGAESPKLSLYTTVPDAETLSKQEITKTEKQYAILSMLNMNMRPIFCHKYRLYIRIHRTSFQIPRNISFKRFSMITKNEMNVTKKCFFFERLRHDKNRRWTW